MTAAEDMAGISGLERLRMWVDTRSDLPAREEICSILNLSQSGLDRRMRALEREGYEFSTRSRGVRVVRRPNVPAACVITTGKVVEDDKDRKIAELAAANARLTARIARLNKAISDVHQMLWEATGYGNENKG